MRCVLIQYNWYPYKEEKIGTQTEEDHVKTRREGHLQAKKRGFRRN